MLNKIKLFLVKNFYFKILSLVLAIILWIIAIKINNPVVARKYSIKLDLLNIRNLSANNLSLLNEKELSDNKIDVEVRATRDDLKFIDKNTDNLKANIDFKNIDGSYEQYINKGFSLPVNISFSSYLNTSRYQILKVYPSKLEINLDKLISEKKKIYYEIDGEPEKNFYIKNVKIDPEDIDVVGAKSIMEIIKPINLNLNAGGAKKDIFTKIPIKIYNKNGIDVTDNLNLSDNEADVFIEIDTYKKISVERPKTIGKIADGYVIKNIDYSPKEIEITGNEKIEIKSLKLPEIDINNASLSKNISYDLNDLLSKYGLEIKKGSENKILVTVDIEKIN